MKTINPVKVKICGIKDLAGAMAAVDAGADALGFVFAPGPRQVQREVVRDICTRLPPFIARVGVFVNAPIALAEETAAYCGLDTLQLHGQETPEYCRSLKYKIIKAFRVKDANTLDLVKDYDVEAVLLDAYVPGAAGGTGRCFDWNIARELAAARRVILAGGLRPDNVRLAVETAGPYAVDVSSGVENGGQKDPDKIRLFIQAVKGGVGIDQ